MSTPVTIVLPKRNIAHLDIIKSALPDWITLTSPNTLKQLKNVKPQLPEWFKKAPAAQHKELRNAQTASWTKRNDVENELKKILDVYSFAEPLLKQSIKQRYQLDIDVKETFIHLYIPKTDFLGLSTDGTTTWRVSVLDAALHNFEAFEGKPDAHLRESGFITRPDERGQYDILGDVTRKLPVDQFINFCRDLDIGGKYDAHLKEELGLNDRAKQLRLKDKIVDSHRLDLKAVAHHAGVTQDIEKSTCTSLLSFIEGKDSTWETHCLKLLSTPLTGPLLFIRNNKLPSTPSSVVVYIPHDPVHPLKEYPSMAVFMTKLTEQLRSDTYKQFFSRFINHDQLGTFYSTLKRRYYHVIEDRPSLPDKELIPVENPALGYETEELTNDIWADIYSRQLKKIFNDAKVLAVSTDSEDRKTRHDRWERIKSIGLALLNAAMFVIAPFIPVVGELMLAQMAYQLLDDTYEGVRDWIEGKSVEAFEHLLAVLDSVLQAAGFALGGTIIGDLIPKPSAFVENLIPVTSSDSIKRLWNPDLAPYAHPTEVPQTSIPNELGLHEHNQQTLLKLQLNDDLQHTLVLTKPENGQHYTLVHPTRAEAFAPKMEHNGHGAWLMEGERPQTWEGTTLMRRLGHATDGFNDAELQKVRAISGTDEGVLRRVHLYKQAMPPLLDDSLTRFKLQKTVKQNIEHIRAGEAINTEKSWLASMATELDSWPTEKALEVSDPGIRNGAFHFGKNVPAQDTFRISLTDLNDGKLTPLIVDGLNEQQLNSFLGPDTPKEQAAQRLNEKLANKTDSSKKEIFDTEYNAVRSANAPDAVLIERTFPELPAPVTRTLLKTASTAEKADMTHEHRIPLRLKNLAREMEVQTKITRAQEGLIEDDLLSPEGEKLALNTIKIYSDAISDVHIEVRDGSFHGSLRSDHEPTHATIKRVLIRKGLGKYEVRDGNNKLLNPPTTFHNALLKALPQENLNKLTSRFSPGENFKQWLADKYHITGEVRTALDFSTVNTSVARETETLLRGPIYSRLLPQEVVEDPLIGRVKTLYPHRSESEINVIVSRINSEDMLQKLTELESEKEQLFRELDEWTFPTSAEIFGTRHADSIIEDKRDIASRLKESWLRADKEHINRGGVKDLAMGWRVDNIPMDSLRPEALRLSKKLTHITDLTLNNCNLSDLNAEFLTNFPNLRKLSVQGNKLQKLPEALKEMPRLENLDLSNNNIVMDPSNPPLQGMAHLKRLDLSRNPLGSPPDVSQMPKLRTLILDRTQITDWPEGLFSHPRPRRFGLSLQGNEITTVPDYPPGSEESWLVAQTRIDRQKLDVQNENKLAQYRKSFGLDPHRTYPPRGDEGSRFWLEQLSGHTQHDIALKKAMWNEVETEHGSQGFFEVIDRMKIDAQTFQTEEDAQAYEDNLENLAEQVWRVISAARNDENMLAKLFRMASAPTNCADAGAQIFNAMGIETMVYEFYEANSLPQVLDKNLITLARGKARLNKLYEIARADVAHRVSPKEKGGLGLRFISDVVDGVPGAVDEVEVHTAYQARLSNSLELPWVSEHMVYRHTANVGNKEVVRAYNLILEGERDDGIVNQILEVEFWDTYLEETHAQEIQKNAEFYETQSEQLNDLQEKQHQWVNSNASLEKRDPALKQALSELASQLSVPEADVLTEEEMSDSTYNRIYSEIDDRRKELSSRLTREALSRAGLIKPLPPL